MKINKDKVLMKQIPGQYSSFNATIKKEEIYQIQNSIGSTYICI